MDSFSNMTVLKLKRNVLTFVCTGYAMHLHIYHSPSKHGCIKTEMKWHLSVLIMQCTCKFSILHTFEWAEYSLDF